MAANTARDNEAPRGFPTVTIGTDSSGLIHYDGGEMEGGFNITFCGEVYKPIYASYPDLYLVCNCPNCLSVALFGTEAHTIETQQRIGGS